MRLRRVVLQNPPKSSVPPGLPFYQNRPLRTRSESTLLQVLIPLRFNFSRINTYKKPGSGSPPSDPKVLQLATTPTSPYHSLSTVSPPSVTSFRATLASYRHLAENKTTLSPVVATLTDRVKHKSFACHSYKKHPGWGYPSAGYQSFLFPSLSSRGVASDPLLPFPDSLPRTVVISPSHRLDICQAQDTDHGSRDTGHGYPLVVPFRARRIQNGQTEAVHHLWEEQNDERRDSERHRNI